MFKYLSNIYKYKAWFKNDKQKRTILIPVVVSLLIVQIYILLPTPIPNEEIFPFIGVNREQILATFSSSRISIHQPENDKIEFSFNDKGSEEKWVFYLKYTKIWSTQYFFSGSSVESKKLFQSKTSNIYKMLEVNNFYLLEETSARGNKTINSYKSSTDSRTAVLTVFNDREKHFIGLTLMDASLY